MRLLRHVLIALGLLLAGPALADNCVTLPHTLLNGTVADAAQVMADFNSIVTCVNNPNTLWDTGNFSITDSKSTAIVADGAAIKGASVSGTTANQIYNWTQNAAPGTLNTYDAGRFVAVNQPGSTVFEVQGVAGYVLNNNSTGATSQAVAVWGNADCAVSGSQCWGLATIVSDQIPGATGTNTHTGVFLYNEFDLNVTSASTSGAMLQLGGTALPTGVTLNINGLSLNRFWGAGGAGTATSLLSNGIVIANACCQTGILIGANALSGATHDGMPIVMQFWAGDATEQYLSLTPSPSGAVKDGTLFLGAPTGKANLALANGSIYLPNNSGVFANLLALATMGGTTANMCNDSGFAICNVGASATQVAVLGKLSVNTFSAAAIESSVCMDASNVIRKVVGLNCF